jgi:hypothetical protein
MYRKLIPLILLAAWFAGCTGGAGSSVLQNKELTSYGNYTTLSSATIGGDNDLIFHPSEVEAALPAITDLPVPATLKQDKRTTKYTGIIKNKTNYEISVPAGDSDGTIFIPAKGWIEYSAWGRRFDVTAYRDGKPFYCLKIYVHPKDYPFMCKKYDFMVEIAKPEPRKKPVGKKMKRAIKKRKAPKNEVEAFG